MQRRKDVNQRHKSKPTGERRVSARFVLAHPQHALGRIGPDYKLFRHYGSETGRYTSPDPLGLAPAPNPVAYVDNPHSGCDQLGLMPKFVERAQDGGFRKRHDYHRDTRHAFSDERVVEILKNPDAVYHSGTAGTFTFRQGDDIVVIDGPGTTQGQAITAYGPSGIKGESGATALGGKSTDPGAPVTHEDIMGGRIPAKGGGWLQRRRSDGTRMTMRRLMAAGARR